MNIKIKGVWLDTNRSQTIIYKQDDMWVAWTVDDLKDTSTEGIMAYMNNPDNNTKGCSVSANHLYDIIADLRRN